jgi:hypothetical protein
MGYMMCLYICLYTQFEILQTTSCLWVVHALRGRAYGRTTTLWTGLRHVERRRHSWPRLGTTLGASLWGYITARGAAGDKPPRRVDGNQGMDEGELSGDRAL